jgi:hypothetical protein
MVFFLLFLNGFFLSKIKKIKKRKKKKNKKEKTVFFQKKRKLIIKECLFIGINFDNLY